MIKSNKRGDYLRQQHTIESLYDESSKILILGSFPSVASREQGFFYGHKQNRFWKVVSAVINKPTPQTIEEKREFLLKNHIALWDVIASCKISGSSDSSIKNVKPNDIGKILKSTNIKAIFTNGKAAFNLYNKYILTKTKITPIYLPSTSPANAAFSLERLIEEWKKIKEFL